MDKKTVLHITNDYSSSEVYKNLVRELDNLGIPQIVYTAVKSALSIGSNEIPLKTPGSKIIYANIVKKTFHRIFYRLKIKTILKNIRSKVGFSQIGMIHAHTWYSDGGAAFLLHKKYKIPYIITIRNTDLNVFQKYLIHERRFGRQVLKYAERIILISESYKSRILDLPSLQSIKEVVENKIQVIPNGVDPFWIDHYLDETERKIHKEKINLLFIGKFTRGKNVTLLQKAVILLNSENKTKINLHIVGGGGSESDEVLQIIKSYPDCFTFHGKIHDKEQLLSIIRSCDIFCMPSRSETFGLVYVEAMLQQLLLLYTYGEGIDGFYEEKIGEKVQSFSVEEIKEKIELLINNYKSYNIPVEKLLQNHDWRLIAKKYQEMY